MRYTKHRSYEPAVLTSAAAAVLLAVPFLLGWPDRLMTAELTLQNGDAAYQNTQGSAKASARASSSSSVSAGKAGTECHATSSSLAEARAGKDYSFEMDEDVKNSNEGGCSAKAESRASAKTGQGNKD